MTKRGCFGIVLAAYLQRPKRQTRIVYFHFVQKKTMHQENTSLFDGTKLEHKVKDEERRRSIYGYDIRSLPVIHARTSSERL